jgi:hypothetical protein
VLIIGGLMVLAAGVNIALCDTMAAGRPIDGRYSWDSGHPIYVHAARDTICAFETGGGQRRTVPIDADGYLGLGNVSLPRGRWIEPWFGGPATITCGTPVVIKEPRPAALYAIATGGVARTVDQLAVLIPFGFGLAELTRRFVRSRARAQILTG